MITAEEFAVSNQYDLECHDEGGYQGIDTKIFAKKLIEFAKMHCEEQAKVISENACLTLESEISINGACCSITAKIDNDSLNAYSLDLIK